MKLPIEPGNKIPQLEKMAKYDLRGNQVKHKLDLTHKLNYVFASYASYAGNKIEEIRQRLRPLTVEIVQKYTDKIEKQFNVMDMAIASFHSFESKTGAIVIGMHKTVQTTSMFGGGIKHVTYGA